MANDKNLKPFNKMCSEDAEKIQSKGGKARAKKIQERKALKEELLLLLAEKDTQKRLSLALIEKALTGDVRAFETIRDTIGEKPIDKKEIKEELGQREKVFITPEDLKDINKLQRFLNRSKGAELVFLSEEDIKEADRHINEFINGY